MRMANTVLLFCIRAITARPIRYALFPASDVCLKVRIFQFAGRCAQFKDVASTPTGRAAEGRGWLKLGMTMFNQITC